MNSGPTSPRSPVHSFVRGDRWRAGPATTPDGVHNSIANRAEAYNEFQQCMTTTKDTKSTKGSEDETRDAVA